MNTDKVCETCHKKPDAAGLRRGLCRACYLRVWRGSSLPPSAHCAFCAERRRAVLRWTKAGDEKAVTCQNCGFIADRLRPRPDSLAKLRAALRRERRDADRRKSWILGASAPSSERRGLVRRRRRIAF
jgi:hypothetical protein